MEEIGKFVHDKVSDDIIYLKGKFIGFKMIKSKCTSDNLEEFNKLVIHLENVDIKIEEEGKEIILLISLPKSYSVFVNTMKYATESS